MHMTRTTAGVVVAVAAAAIFGLYPSATRAVYADGGNAVFVIMLTTFARALTMGIFCAAVRRPIFQNSRDTKAAITNALFHVISVVGVLGGMVFLPGPIVIVIIFSYPFMLYLYLVFRREEIFKRSIVVLIAIALCGLGLVLNVQNHFNGLHWLGLILAAMGALATASRVYVYGTLMVNRDPITVGTETFLLATLFSCSLMLYALPIIPTSAAGMWWAALAAASVSIGNFGMFYGIAMLGAFRFAFISKIEPVFAAVFAALLIGETLSFSQYLGMAIVLSSLAVYQKVTAK